MIEKLRERASRAVQEAVLAVTGERIEPPAVQDPPRPEMGDLAIPVALQLGRRLGRDPRKLAGELVTHLEEHPVGAVRRWEIAGPGFLNVHLERAVLLYDLVRELGQSIAPVDEKVVVEHTSINPNKAAHIGHLRNACLGDTVARVLRHRGHPVEVHNYIDDTGAQVADVVMGFLDLREMDAEAVAALPEPFDYFCWDLYTEVSERLDEDERLRQRRRDVLRAIEDREGVEAEVQRVVVDRIVGRHLRTMRRLDIDYELLVKEGDVLSLDLWSEAFERLRRSDSVYYAEDGKHAGCWMMSLTAAPGFESLEEADKVLVRSNGVATYVAKDIAYHLWKYGLLDRDFRYRRVPDAPADEEVWQTTTGEGENLPFGHADRAVTVIDVRQSYLQAIVGQAFHLIDEPEPAESFTHFAYEMVALSPRTAAALGIPVGDEEEDRQFVEMSGRRGYGVKADDLLDELERRAGAEVGERNPELEDAERQRLARQIAVGAARYFLLRFSRNTVIVFDLDDALSFEGETGPYLQYAAVRASHIFEKLLERGPDEARNLVLALGDAVDNAAVDAVLDGLDANAMATRLAEDDGELWSLILALGRLEEAVDLAARTLEISGLAKYAFTLAQHFNRFYHGYPILQAEDPVDRDLRILVAHAFQRQLATALALLGIPLPDRM